MRPFWFFLVNIATSVYTFATQLILVEPRARNRQRDSEVSGRHEEDCVSIFRYMCSAVRKQNKVRVGSRKKVFTGFLALFFTGPRPLTYVAIRAELSAETNRLRGNPFQCITGKCNEIVVLCITGNPFCWLT